jgi:hypothetical protein
MLSLHFNKDNYWSATHCFEIMSDCPPLSIHRGTAGAALTSFVSLASVTPMMMRVVIVMSRISQD